MTYENAVTQLRNHSHLGQGAETPGLLYELWKADRDAAPPDLTAHVDSVLRCLAVANLELNGPRPSERSDRLNPQVLSDLAYPVSGLVVGLLRRHRQWTMSGRLPPSALGSLQDAALRIGMAWDMVLAGDHDDLLVDLELEWNAA